MNTYVFYAGLLYGEYWTEYNVFFSLSKKIGVMPDGAYIHFTEKRYGHHWYLSDYTPVLLSDVPKELLALVLLLT